MTINDKTLAPQRGALTTVVKLVEVNKHHSKKSGNDYLVCLTADGAKFYVWNKYFDRCLPAIRSYSPLDQLVLTYNTAISDGRTFNNVVSMAVLPRAGSGEQQTDLSLNEITALAEGSKA